MATPPSDIVAAREGRGCASPAPFDNPWRPRQPRVARRGAVILSHRGDHESDTEALNHYFWPKDLREP
jgi:hypothetical protein